MKLSKEQAKKFHSKLEWRFKNSNSDLVSKLNSGTDVDLTKEEISTLVKKLEYNFKKSSDSDLELVKKSLTVI